MVACWVSKACWVYIVLWVCLVLCLAIIAFAGFSLKREARCALHVGSCLWFPCSDKHGATCHAGRCLCPLDMCAPDGFVCKSRDEVNATLLNKSTIEDASGPFVRNNMQFFGRSDVFSREEFLAYNKTAYAETLRDEFPVEHQWRQVVYVIVVVVVVAAICVAAVQCYFDNFVRKMIYYQYHSKGPSSNEESGCKERCTGGTDGCLLFWFFSGEFFILICFIVAVNEKSNKVLCHPPSDLSLCVGCSLVFLSSIRFEPHFPGFASMWGGSVKDRADKLDEVSRRQLKFGRPRHTPNFMERICRDGDFGRVLQQAVRFLGYNLIIIYGASRSFYLTILVVLLEALHRGLFHMAMLVQSEMWKRRVRKIVADIEEKQNTPQEPAIVQLSIKPGNVFIDLSQPFGIKVSTRFFGQVVLSIAYIFGLKNDTALLLCDEHVQMWDSRGYVMFTSCLVMQFLLSTQMGESFFHDIFNWFLIYSAKAKQIKEPELKPSEIPDAMELEVQAVHEERERNPQEILSDTQVTPLLSSSPNDNYEVLYHPHIKLRAFMSYCVNYVIFTILVETLPLTLMGDDNAMDYVKDCLALAFITTLDDISDGQEMTVTLKKENIENEGQPRTEEP